MNRFLAILTLSVFAAGAPAVFGGTNYGLGQTGQPIPQLPGTQAKTPQQPQKGPDAATPYNQGTTFMKVHDYSAAVPKFEAALKANPNIPQAHLLAAYCLRKLGPANYAASLQHLNSALQLNPKMAEAYESRGVLYVQMGKKEDAQKDLATLKQLDPKLTPALEIALKTGKDVDHY
jgi:tetratricopeptide (TPR) repeat protein